MVSNIQRFSISDGPGVRTTVFLKGCPLACLWCHNPETQAAGPELMFYAETCTLCGACAAACPNGAHTIMGGRHTIDRARCVLCGLCAAACPARALELRGEAMTPAEVMAVVLRDRMFYETTGGGVTVSGGEPLFQFDFTRELLRAAKAEGLHTCLDTSGFGGGAEALVHYVDLYLWDVKETDPALHLAATGVELAPLLEGLRAVDAAGGAIRLRCPIVPGVNDREGHIRAIAALANGLANLRGIDLIPYHRMGVGKAEAIGLAQAEYETIPQERRDGLLAVLTANTRVPSGWHQ